MITNVTVVIFITKVTALTVVANKCHNSNNGNKCNCCNRVNACLMTQLHSRYREDIVLRAEELSYTVILNQSL